ncbi:MAG: hypothetical protein ABW036_13845, partial [Flavitalea sp.]
DTFFSFPRIRFEDIKDVVAVNGNLTLTCTVKVPKHYLEIFKQAPYSEAIIQIGIMKKDTVPDYYSSVVKVKELTTAKTELNLSFKIPDRKGELHGRLATESRIRNQPTLNSVTFPFEMQ